jgi:hypothetical protein
MTILIMIKLIVYMVYLTILKLIMAQLPMKNLIKIETNH